MWSARVPATALADTAMAWRGSVDLQRVLAALVKNTLLNAPEPVELPSIETVDPQYPSRSLLVTTVPGASTARTTGPEPLQSMLRLITVRWDPPSTRTPLRRLRLIRTSELASPTTTAARVPFEARIWSSSTSLERVTWTPLEESTPRTTTWDAPLTDSVFPWPRPTSAEPIWSATKVIGLPGSPERSTTKSSSYVLPVAIRTV